MTFGTATFSEELLFRSTYSLNLLSGYCCLFVFFSGNGYCLEDLFEASNFCKENVFFLQNTPWSRPFFKKLTSFGGSAWAIHSFMVGDFFNGIVAVIHSFSGIYFDRRTCYHPLSNSFSNRSYNYFLEYSQTSIFSTVLCIFLTFKFSAIQFGQRTFFRGVSEHKSPWNKLLIEAAIFSEQHRLYWNESSHLK